MNFDGNFLRKKESAIAHSGVHNVLTYKGRNYLPFSITWVHPQYLIGLVLLIVLVFCVVACHEAFLEKHSSGTLKGEMRGEFSIR
jgi:hypothetical protein